MTRSELADLTDDELGELLSGVCEQYGDMQAEHLAETARFGDSWPGAQITLAAMRQDIALLEAEADRRRAARPPAPVAALVDDEPF